MKIEGDTITFSSGRTAYANCGIVGLAENMEVSYGYDGRIDWPPSEWQLEDRPDEALTADDMCELADHMIGLWTKFKDSL